MDRFYLENVARYQRLVKSISPTAAPRAEDLGKQGTSPDMIVCARIRPLLSDDDDAGFPRAIFPRVAPAGMVDIHDLYNHPRGIPILKSFSYEVDKLFDSGSTTEDIFEDLVADLIPPAWNGSIGTLFTYGQTGSGKTFTVTQLEQLVAESLMNGGLGGERQVYITIIELAGNSVYDLLDSRKPINLLDDAAGVTQLAGAGEHLVRNKDEVTELTERAATFRRTASTFRNDASSRSHGICRLRIHNEATDSDGVLYLIDLAGSEAARDMADHGADRMRETREINISLSVLKDCIRGISQVDRTKTVGGRSSKKRMPYVPFRQSALTRVLRHVFDPASNRVCKTIVIACLNPSLADVGASKNTLRYAEMLRVFMPIAKETQPDLKKLDHLADSLTIPGRTSSREMEPAVVSLPFKERIRPGMAVSWKQPSEEGPSANITESPNLAIVLCPIEAARRTVIDDLEKMAEPHPKADDNNEVGDQYLCSSVTALATGGAYELHLWRQFVLDINMMTAEVTLEYDSKTRCYYVAI